MYVGYNEFIQTKKLSCFLSNPVNTNESEIESILFKSIEEGLIKVLNEEKRYLDPALTLNELAKLVGSNHRYLSNFLKIKYGANFSTYIDSHRIEESKKLLLSKENDNFTIETIANMAGFHSKLPFNIAFKATMGFTPSEFRKNHISSEIG